MGIIKKQYGTSSKSAASTGHILHHQAFDNAFQATILATLSNGKIIIANKAACKLLGYSKKQLLSKNMSAIFNSSKRTDKGEFSADIITGRKNSKLLPCHISSVIFIDEDAVERAIITITNLTESIKKQKIGDAKKEKIVADNITVLKSKQRKIDTKNKQAIADNLVRSTAEGMLSIILSP